MQMPNAICHLSAFLCLVNKQNALLSLNILENSSEVENRVGPFQINFHKVRQFRTFGREMVNRISFTTL